MAAWALARFTHTNARNLVPVVMFTNCGNKGRPVGLRPEGFGAAVGLSSISNLIHFSLGARVTNVHASTRELLISALMIASALGFISAATGVRPPDMIFIGMKMLGEAMAPLMLFSLGRACGSRNLNAKTFRELCWGLSRVG
ncbi:hypothetical protein [Bradyrhizobium sp. LMTR 3]|uniref:hypothetical protein n=1 Tax=Bradyrhizobium sp. LMTR 3 TaxID=189873 RepID=UPI000810EAE5|nr:hypothetical protein [Bradyrhizobium sp. LMTR 3]OCK57455.1 hypothetical protein LMTR3_21330 [Bradyrhizobium sp. LMTR 3]